MSNIKEQISQEIGALSTSMKPMPEKHAFYRNTLREFLNCKEVRVVPAAQRDEIFGWSPTVLYPEYERLYNSLGTEDKPGKDWSGLKDGFNVSELFVDSRRYIVDPDYLRYIKATDGSFVINVYGADSSLISKKFWEFTDHTVGRSKFANGQIPEYNFATPAISGYAAFGKTTYWDDVYVESCQDAMAVLAIDLPHKYYSTQILKGNIFTWDVATEKYQVGGKDMYEINLMIEDIAARGLNEPLMMRINEGCLTPVDNDTAIKLFLATYMNLPTIPVVLYMSDDTAVKNRGYEELHEAVHSDIWHSEQALSVINDICKPYFFFEMVKDTRSKSYLQVGQTLLAKSQYPTMQNVEDLSVEVFDRHLDTKAPHEDVQVPMSDEEIQVKLQQRGQQLMDELIKKQDAEAKAHIQKILDGGFN